MRILWVVFQLVLAIPALFVSFGWFNLVLSPRQMASGMGWSVPKAIGMQLLFTVVLLIVYAVGYAVAFRTGVVQ